MAENNKDDIEETLTGDDNGNNTPVRPDLGIGNVAGRISPIDIQPQPPAPDAVNRREDNPFSFKKFLNQDLGARRKEYPGDSPLPLHTAPLHVNSSEMSSMLPDFVQDHLVVEQCYLSSPSHQVPLPFDLPLPADDKPEPGVAMRLPDFLSDGPIHSHRSEEESIASNGRLSPGPPPRNENDRLEREVNRLRRQLNERNRRIQLLESEIGLLHCRDARETDSLEYALKQVEANLKQTTKRAIAAEQQVAKLKAENSILKSRLDTLDQVAAGPSSSHETQSQNQRLAHDLRAAAVAAEIHLCSLMAGIDNLKMLAYSLDNKGDIENDKSSTSDSGPTL